MRFIERRVVAKDVIAQNYWSFELGVVILPINIVIQFQQRDRKKNQLKNDTVDRPPVFIAQCCVAPEKKSRKTV